MVRSADQSVSIFAKQTAQAAAGFGADFAGLQPKFLADGNPDNRSSLHSNRLFRIHSDESRLVCNRFRSKRRQDMPEHCPKDAKAVLVSLAKFSVRRWLNPRLTPERTPPLNDITGRFHSAGIMHCSCHGEWRAIFVNRELGLSTFVLDLVDVELAGGSCKQHSWFCCRSDNLSGDWRAAVRACAARQKPGLCWCASIPSDTGVQQDGAKFGRPASSTTQIRQEPNDVPF